MYVCVCVCVCVCVSVYVCRVYVCMYSMYVCMYVCVWLLLYVDYRRYRKRFAIEVVKQKFAPIGLLLHFLSHLILRDG